jgi:hypothetical protein
MPSSLWHYEFTAYPSTEAQQEQQQAEGWLFSRQECRQAAEFTRTFWWEIGRFCAAASKPSKDHQGRDSVLLHANHQWQKNLFKDPEVLLTAELGSWPWRLQEQTHGASVRALSQWGAQSGCWQRPRQLDDVELDSSNKAEAACWVKASSKPTSVPMLGMFLLRLPFLVRTAVPPKRSHIFGGNDREMELRETTCKNKTLFYRTSTYIVGNMPSTDVWEMSSNRKSCWSLEMRLGKKS